MLETAVDQKIEEQAEFVEWWDKNVSVNKGARTDLNAELRFSKSDAESLTKIPQQQVSRWRKKLKTTDTYRAHRYTARPER